MATEIKPGDLVVARSAFGERLGRRAMSGRINGKEFAVVWVCREDEWEAADREGREPEGVPWPAEDVELVAQLARK